MEMLSAFLHGNSTMKSRHACAHLLPLLKSERTVLDIQGYCKRKGISKHKRSVLGGE